VNAVAHTVARLLAFISVCVVLPACREAPATPAADGSAEVIWRPVGNWSGRGNSQTGSFSVETGALRVKWETRNESPSGTGTFRVSLHSAISGRVLQVVVDQRGAGRDTLYIEDEPRVSYLVVDSKDVDWSMTVEEAVPTTVTSK
jgi:hypothetical protein